MRTITNKAIDWFRPDPSQPRKSFDAEELRLLNSTLRIRQLVPVIAKADGRLIDGERRWRAAQLGGVESLDVIITDETLSEGQVKEIQLLSLQRADLKPYELFLGCMEWMKVNPGSKAMDLAGRIGRDPSTISRVLSLARCIPAVREAAEAGALGISDWAAISKVSEQEQHALLAAKLSGASRDDLERRRKVRNAKSQDVKLSRVKVSLGGNSVVLTGKDLGMTEVVTLLGEVLKEARKAAEQFDVKTWQAMMRDKAKAAV